MVISKLKIYKSLPCSLNIMIRNISYQFRPELLDFYCKTFDVPQYKIQSILVKYPKLQKLTEDHINETIEICKRFNLQKHDILGQPKLLNFYPAIIENRLMVLKECGFHRIDCKILSKYVQLMVRRFNKLQKIGYIEDKHVLYQHLAECFRDWPNTIDHLTINIPNVERMPLCDIRIHILKKFLQAKFDMPDKIFEFILKTYSQIKHRPFEKISKVLHMLEKDFKFPREKFFSNGFFFMLEPENVSGLLNEVKTFGGIDIKELIMKYPAITRTNYKNILKVKKILKDAEISEEAQQKCPEICRVSPTQVQERLNELKTKDNFKGYLGNSQALKLIYHHKKVFKRLDSLSKSNKKCRSIHKLVSANKEFNRYLKNPDDKSKGVDIIKALKIYFKPTVVNEDEIRDQLLRQPLWTHASITSINQVFEYLSQYFDTIDIFHNCPLLLYHFDDVKYMTSSFLDAKNNGHIQDSTIFSELMQQNLEMLNGGQILSLIMYFLERQYDFTGYGVIKKEERLSM